MGIKKDHLNTFFVVNNEIKTRLMITLQRHLMIESAFFFFSHFYFIFLESLRGIGLTYLK